MWTKFFIFPHCGESKFPSDSTLFLYRQNKHILSSLHEYIDSYILVVVHEERVHSKLVVLIRRMKVGNNIGRYLQNLEIKCVSNSNFENREVFCVIPEQSVVGAISSGSELHIL